MMELIESMEDCLRRERRLFRWTCGWFGVLLALPVIFVGQAVVFGKLIILCDQAGINYIGIYYLEQGIRSVLFFAELLCVIAFPSAMFSWMGAIRRRRFCHEVLGDGRNHPARMR